LDFANKNVEANQFSLLQQSIPRFDSSGKNWKSKIFQHKHASQTLKSNTNWLTVLLLIQKEETHADGAKKLYDAYLLDKRYNQFVLPASICKC
jgi:hypothetical protein